MSSKRAPSKTKRKPSRDRQGFTPLMCASLAGDLKKVRALLQRGADVDDGSLQSNANHQLLHLSFTTRDAGRTALMLAAFRGHVEIVEALLAAGADVNLADGEGNTALGNAAGSGDRRAVELLLDHGAEVNPQTKFHPLYRAAVNGHVELVRRLLDAGADIDAPIWTGDTALACAYEADEAKGPVMRLLLERGARPDIPNRHRQTALHKLIANCPLSGRDEAPDLVNLLLERGADPAAADHQGVTPLYLAAGRHRHALSIVEALTRAGAPVDVPDCRQRRPLLHACEMEHLDVALHLLDRGASLEATDAEGNTPFRAVAANGYLELAKLLIARGARIDPEARTAAQANGRHELVRLIDQLRT